VGRSARLLEFFNRQVVHAQNLDAVLDDVFGARFGHADVIGMEVGGSPESGVDRLDEHADVFREIELSEVVGADALSGGHLDDARPADEHLERQSVGAKALIEKVTRRVDVRPGMGAQMQRRHVRAVAAGQTLDGFQRERRVIWICGQVRIERY
jgi:hypothetical protein